MIKVLDKETFENELYDITTSSFKNKKPIVIDFYADWCGPCKVLAPIVESLSEEYSELIDFYKANVDEQNAIAKAFEINSVPTLMYVNPGNAPIGRVGAVSKSKIIEDFKRVFAPEF